MSATVPLTTKGGSLASLRGRLTTAEVLPLVLVDHSTWTQDRRAELQRVLREPWAVDRPLIVRSSALVEGTSEAGHYLTVPRVRGAAALAAAVDRVFASYDPPGPADQVLIQPELAAIACAGVATTREPATGSPYHVVSWALTTSTVTAGRAGDTHTWRGAAHATRTVHTPAPVDAVLKLLTELEQQTGEDALAVEWAQTPTGTLVLVQVQRISVDAELPASTHRQLLTHVEDTFVATADRDVLGTHTVLGRMPDWNIAELAGRRPRPLARNLFGFLISKTVWSRARVRHGYRPVDGDLLVDLGGMPFIDVRASATSLIPSALSDSVAERFVDAWLDRLVTHPHLHDKVESAVYVPSLGLRTPGRIEQQSRLGLQRSDVEALRVALASLTSAMINGTTWADDLQRVERLADIADQASDGRGLLTRLGLCREQGTLPFASLARCAFVGREILDDLVAEQVFSADERAAFVAGLDLVSGQLRRDVHELTADEVLVRYGHLRPGTWDIRAARYDETPDAYLGAAPSSDSSPTTTPFAASTAQLDRIATLLDRRGLRTTPPQLLDFTAATIRGRERAKFLFTKILSDVLRDLTHLGEQLGLSTDDLSYLGDVRLLGELTGTPAHDRAVLEAAIAAGREHHERSRWVELPALLSHSDQIWAFTVPGVDPTFVTDARVRAAPARVDDGEKPDGKIALIESADPGYDWILTHKIDGLVTAWGGANSHMAMRAIERGLPAAIGVGTERFRELWRARVIELDAGAGTVSVVS